MNEGILPEIQFHGSEVAAILGRDLEEEIYFGVLRK